jgi:RecB family endonuclease NucS
MHFNETMLDVLHKLGAARSGALCIGLTEAVRHELDERAGFKKKLSSRRAPGSIAERMDEKSLETVLANRPDLIESGLTVFQRARARQSRIPVGIIDLLCIDRHRNYVVVEIKRPAADYREVVGQITTYMGWVRRNIATKEQSVRGIIVVGRQSERLEYSLDLIPDISVRTFF